MTDILDIPADTPQAMDTKRDIMGTGVVLKILARQEDGGYWVVPEDFYIRSKYKGTVWQLIILAELGTDGRDEHIHKLLANLGIAQSGETQIA